MDRVRLSELLEAFQRGERNLEQTLAALAELPFRHAGDTLADTHRELRTGFPEAVFAEGKTPGQSAEAAAALAAAHDRVLVTRAGAAHAAAVLRALPDAVHEPVARCLSWRAAAPPPPRGRVAVVTAGSSDRSVAAEAACTLAIQDVGVERLDDVGVAGLPRLLAHVDVLRSADALVVCAGMEGALPSVVAGLVACPVIAVPTSVGYGASYGGLAALLAMLNGCAPGVGVVNIDNGFGAALLAGRVVGRRGSG